MHRLSFVLYQTQNPRGLLPSRIHILTPPTVESLRYTIQALNMDSQSQAGRLVLYSDASADDDERSDQDTDDLSDLMPPPPTDQTYETAEHAIKAINQFTKYHGYALTKRRSKVHASTKEVRKIWLQCDRGRQYKTRIDENQRVKKRTSTCNDCPFKTILQRAFPDHLWVLTIENPRHNHEPSPVSTHPSLRRLELDDKSERIDAQLYIGVSTRKILTGVRREDPDSSLKSRDVYNYRRKKHVEFLNGRTPIQALLMALPEEGNWIFNYQLEDSNEDESSPLSALFCTHKSSLELLRLYPTALFMDCTYKTNKYKMPLLDIVGVTATNSTFYVGFAFVKDEKQPTYEFVLKCLDNLYRQLNIPSPMTTFVDKDQGLINALEVVFPGVNIILCIWHINKDILKKARPLIRTEIMNAFGADDPEFNKEVLNKWKEMLTSWYCVVNAITFEEKDSAWRDFKHKYRHPIWAPLIEYLRSEWLETRTARHFLHVYTTKNILHLDNTTTSRDEGAHSMIKRDLEVSTNDFLTGLRSMERTLTHQHRKVIDEIEQEKVSISVSHRIPLFREVIGKISSTALAKTLTLRNNYLPVGAPGRREIKPCTGVTKKTVGIPCIHEIRQVFEGQRSLSIAHFHSHWHLCPTQEVAPIDPRLLVLEPETARTRGRPAGSQNRPMRTNQNNSTRREPSGFEYEAIEEARDRDGNREQGQGGRRGQADRGRGRGSRGRGRGQGRDSQYAGIPSEMTGVLEF